MIAFEIIFTTSANERFMNFKKFLLKTAEASELSSFEKKNIRVILIILMNLYLIHFFQHKHQFNINITDA